MDKSSVTQHRSHEPNRNKSAAQRRRRRAAPEYWEAIIQKFSDPKRPRKVRDAAQDTTPGDDKQADQSELDRIYRSVEEFRARHKERQRQREQLSAMLDTIARLPAYRPPTEGDYQGWLARREREQHDAKRTEEKEAMSDVLQQSPADWFATFNFNSQITPQSARRRLRAFHARLDRKILGRNWMKSDDRTGFIAIPERKADGALHYHAVVKLPRNPIPGRCARTEAEKVWKKLSPAGDLHVAPIRNAEDQRKVSDYMTKRSNASRNFIMSSEFCGR